jgi:hypothetical protein
LTLSGFTVRCGELHSALHVGRRREVAFARELIIRARLVKPDGKLITFGNSYGFKRM